MALGLYVTTVGSVPRMGRTPLEGANKRMGQSYLEIKGLQLAVRYESVRLDYPSRTPAQCVSLDRSGPLLGPHPRPRRRLLHRAGPE